MRLKDELAQLADQMEQAISRDRKDRRIQKGVKEGRKLTMHIEGTGRYETDKDTQVGVDVSTGDTIEATTGASAEAGVGISTARDRTLEFDYTIDFEGWWEEVPPES